MEGLQFEPMTVGQILDKAFRLWRANFVHYVALVAVVLVPLHVISLLWQVVLRGAVASGGGAAMPVAILGMIVVVILAVVGQNLGRAALMRNVSESYLGKEATVGQAYRTLLPKLMSVIWASVLVGLVVGLGFMLLVVPGIIFSLWYALTIPVLILEGRKSGESMKRSKSLVSGNLGKVFVLAFVVFIITAIILWIFGFVGGMIAGLVGAEGELIVVFVTGLFSLFGEIMAMPISAAAYVLLYYDLRIRKEGFDLEMLAQSLGTEVPPSDVPPAP